MITDINEFAYAVHENAIEKGFHPTDESEDQFIANQCNNMHAEITELWDAFRSDTQYQWCDKAAKMRELGLTPIDCAQEELADIIIRALDVSERIGINIVVALNSKHEYNKTRPYKHGKKN